MIALFLATALAGTPVTIDVWGQSNALGYSTPLNGTALPAAARLVVNGTQVFAYNSTKAGIETGLVPCLIGLGYDPTISVRAVNGRAMAALRDNQVPLMITDAATWGTPAAAVLIHGEQDAAALGTARDYGHKLFGPEFEAGPGVLAVDTSAMGRLRTAFGPRFPLVITELRLDAQTAYPFADLSRASQHIGCALDVECTMVRTAAFPLSTGGVHYGPQGFYDLGLAVCARLNDAGYLP